MHALKPVEQLPTITPDELEKLHYLVGRFEAMQNLRMMVANQIRAKKKYGMEDASGTLEDIEARENAALKACIPFLRKHPMYEWHVLHTGVADRLAALLIHNLDDLYRFANVAKLWAFCRADGDQWNVCQPGTNRYRGSPRNRSILWLLGKAFKQHGGEYGEVYAQRLTYEQTKPGCGALLRKRAKKGQEGAVFSDCTGATCSEKHMDRKAKIYAAKRYVQDYWVAWREIMPAPIRAGEAI